MVCVTTFVTVASVTLGTCAGVTFTGIYADGVIAAGGTAIVTFVWTTWCWCDWICMTFALVLDLCKEVVPLGTDCISTTATVSTLCIDDCFDLGHDWLVGIVTEKGLLNGLRKL